MLKLSSLDTTCDQCFKNDRSRHNLFATPQRYISFYMRIRTFEDIICG